MRNLAFTLLASLLASVSVQAQWSASNPPYVNSNVGIGFTSTTGVAYPLTFNSTAANTKIAIDGSTTNPIGIGLGASGQFRFHLGSTTGKFSFFDGPSGNEIFHIAGNGTAMFSGAAHFLVNLQPARFFRVSGTVGTNNTAALVIGAASTAGDLSGAALATDMVIQNSKSGSSTPATTNLVIANIIQNGSIKFSTKNDSQSSLSDVTKMEIKADGKVAIGTPAEFAAATTPYPAGYNLYVSQGILTPKLKIGVPGQSTWADYVFSKEYKLKSLKEVEDYIQQHGHLPGVPSAEEVVQEGIDVAKMDAKLLEKIEELTLYLIEVKKENAMLKEQNAEILKRLRTK